MRVSRVFASGGGRFLHRYRACYWRRHSARFVPHDSWTGYVAVEPASWTGDPVSPKQDSFIEGTVNTIPIVISWNAAAGHGCADILPVNRNTAGVVIRCDNPQRYPGHRHSQVPMVAFSLVFTTALGRLQASPRVVRIYIDPIGRLTGTNAVISGRLLVRSLTHISLPIPMRYSNATPASFNFGPQTHPGHVNIGIRLTPA